MCTSNQKLNTYLSSKYTYFHLYLIQPIPYKLKNNVPQILAILSLIHWMNVIGPSKAMARSELNWSNLKDSVCQQNDEYKKASEIFDALDKEAKGNKLKNSREKLRNRIHQSVAVKYTDDQIIFAKSEMEQLGIDPGYHKDFVLLQVLRLQMLQRFLAENPFKKKHLKSLFELEGSLPKHADLFKAEKHFEKIVSALLQEIEFSYPLLARHVVADGPFNLRKKTYADFLYATELKPAFSVKLTSLLRNQLNYLALEVKSKETDTRKYFSNFGVLVDFYLENVFFAVSKEVFLTLDLEKEWQRESTDLLLEGWAYYLKDHFSFKKFTLQHTSKTYVEDFPEMAHLYFYLKQGSLETEDYLGLCKNPFGRSKRKEIAGYSALAGHGLFLASAFYFQPLFWGAAAFHTIRFATEMLTDYEQIRVHRALSSHDSHYSTSKVASMFLKAALATAGVYGLQGFVAKIASSNMSFWSVFYPKDLVNLGGVGEYFKNLDWVTYVFINMMTNVVFAKALLDKGKNPLTEVSYYTDTIGNLVLYTSLSNISISLGLSENLALAGLQSLPMAAVMVGVEDLFQSFRMTLNSNYTTDERGQEYFFKIIMTTGILNIYASTVQSELIKGSVHWPVLKWLGVGKATETAYTSIVNMLYNFAKVPLYYGPGYEVGATMFQNRPVKFQEALYNVYYQRLVEPFLRESSSDKD